MNVVRSNLTQEKIAGHIVDLALCIKLDKSYVNLPESFKLVCIEEESNERPWNKMINFESIRAS